MRRTLVASACPWLFLLAGCGGGGNDGSDPGPTPPPNQPPTAEDGSLTLNAGTTTTGRLGGSDPDGDPITFTIVTLPQQGSVQLTDTSTGGFRYQAAASASGEDGFTFRVSDGRASSQATVRVRFNAAPVVQNACYGTVQTATVEGTLPATDAESLTFTLVQEAGNGRVEITDPSTGRFRYVPNRDRPRGPDSFEFRATDPQGAEATATVTVIVAPTVMPLGDSITSGVIAPAVADNERVGYRKRLHDRLTGSGRPVDFVGSLSHGGTVLADSHHEGHGGWQANEIAWGRTAESGDDGVYAWLTQNPADFILLHVGTNDINTNNQDTSADDVRDILRQVHSWAADNGQPVTLILARIIDFNPPDAAGAVSRFNDNVRAMAEAEAEQLKDFLQIVFVDPQFFFQGNPPLYSDQLHPSTTGYGIMADVWYDAIAPRLPNCP